MSSKVTGYPRHNPLKAKMKSRRNPAAFLGFSWGFRPIEAGLRSEPLGAAAITTIAAIPAIPVVITIPIATAATAIITLEAAMPPAAAEPVFAMRQEGE